MSQLSPFKLRPVRRPEGGYTFGLRDPKLAVDTSAKMQASLPMFTTWEKKLGQKCAIPTIADEVPPQNEVTECEQLADHDRELNAGKVTTPSQMSAEDELLFATRKNTSESMAFSLVKTDFTGFLGHMVRTAKQDGLYNFLDGFENEEIKETLDSPPEVSQSVISSERFRISDFGMKDSLGNVDAPKEIIHSKDQAFASSRKPVSPKRRVTPTVATTPPATKSVPDDSKDQASASPRKRLLPQIRISPTPITPPSAFPGMLDGLCSLMDKTSLYLSDQPSAKRITTPKAYKFSISTQPKCHYDSVAFFKAGTNNQQVTCGKRKREDLGFKPHEVIRRGALYATELDVKATLEGDIHPIFDENHWTDCPHHVYEVIKPALLLASKLLTSPQSLQHFQTVLKGERKYCAETSIRKERDCYRIRNDVLLTTESVECLNDLFKSMAGSITFQFLDAANSPTHANKYFATARMVPCNHSSCTISSNPQKTVISLHTDFYIQAQKLFRLQYPDSSQVLRFQFFVAINLMHEFAHAFEIACSPDQARQSREVYMYNWLEEESGRAWETGVFGGLVTVINARCDGLHGLCIVEWPEPGFKDRARQGQAEIWSVPMDFVNGLFQESHWEDLCKKTIGEKGLLGVPKTGAASIGVSSFTTSRFEEVLQAREMGSLELALREVEGVLKCVTKDEEERERKKGRSMHLPRTWMKKLGKRGGVRPVPVCSRITV